MCVYGHYDGKGLNEIENKNTVSLEHIVKYSEWDREIERERREREEFVEGRRVNNREGERETEMFSIHVYVLLTQAHRNVVVYVYFDS